MKKNYTGKPCICGNQIRKIDKVEKILDRTKITVVCHECGAVEMRGWVDERETAERAQG